MRIPQVLPFAQYARMTRSAVTGFLVALFVVLAAGTLAAQDEFDEPAAQPTQRSDPVAHDEDAPPPEVNMLKWALEACGVSYTIVFLLLSVIMVALFVMHLLTIRRDSFCPPQLIDGFERFLSQKQYQEAYDLAKSDDSFLGRVLSAGLAKLSAGYPQAIEAMQEVGEEENMKMEHRLSYMALIGTISPMVGLLGTVHGMIASFSVIAHSSTSPKPSQLAEGISTALFTTLVGLMIAIPAIALHGFMRNQISRRLLEVGVVSEGLMDRFQNVGDRKKTQP